MESLYVKKPIYPLLSLLSATLIFFTGLLISKDRTILYFLAALTIIYLIFGYFGVLIKTVPVFAVIGIVIGAGSFLTHGSVLTGIQTAGRIVLLAYSSVTMVSLPPVQLTRNLIQMKFPRGLALGMMATIRFVPLLMNESKQIREAMRTRGVNVQWYNLSCAYRAFIVPFIMRMISMSDTMAVSVETRGFALSGQPASVYKEVRFTRRDGLFALLLLIIMSGVVML